MLLIETFTFNPFSENTYIVYDDQKNAVIIDPGMINDFEYRTIDNFIKNNQLQLQAIINTHAHLDHIFGVEYIQAKYNVPFLLHEEEQIILDNASESASRFGIQYDFSIKVDTYLKDSYQIGEDILQIFHTPGHSPGSVSFYYPEANWIISGDVLFNRSIGRTDLPLGDYAILEKSIREILYTLPDSTQVFSGHGMPTTIGDEKYLNPFVRI